MFYYGVFPRFSSDVKVDSDFFAKFFNMKPGKTPIARNHWNYAGKLAIHQKAVFMKHPGTCIINILDHYH